MITCMLLVLLWLIFPGVIAHALDYPVILAYIVCGIPIGLTIIHVLKNGKDIFA